jgi:hypothetical protein
MSENRAERRRRSKDGGRGDSGGTAIGTGSATEGYDVSEEALERRHHELEVSGGEGLTPLEEGDQSLVEARAAAKGIESARNVNEVRVPAAAQTRPHRRKGVKKARTRPNAANKRNQGNDNERKKRGAGGGHGRADARKRSSSRK